MPPPLKRLPKPGRKRLGKGGHGLRAGAGYGMGEERLGNRAHARGLRHKASLGFKKRRHQGHRRKPLLGHCNAVTHGAGGAAASVPVGRNDPIAGCADLLHQGIGGRDGRVALIPQPGRDLGESRF